MAKKKKGMTREEAEELYRDLQKAMATMMSNTGKSNTGKAAPGSSPKRAAQKYGFSLKERPESVPLPRSMGRASSAMRSGSATAVTMVLMCAAFKVTLTVLEATGVWSVPEVQASYAPAPQVSTVGFSREEMRVLTALDERRKELEERNNRMDQRERDIELRDRELAVRLTQLRELTEKLRVEREKDEKKSNSQLDQLANVYGSMNPPEAAQLIQQLDVTIALALIERMPEKRIGQILGLMTPDKALAITRMLSGKAGMTP